ncbi:MAG: DUF1576 domain-containing protein [Proteocatella sp.]
MKKRKLLYHYLWIIVLFSFFIICGMCLQPADEILKGLYLIITDPSILVSDYLAIGGIGATFINAGLLGIICTALVMKLDMKPNGSIFMALFLVFGFAFFGKNLLNIWPIVIGSYMYSRKKGQPFRNYIIIALMSTSLAPAVNQIFLIIEGPTIPALVLSTVAGVGLGFVMPPISSHCVRMHEGFILTNAGFASGFVAILFVSMFRAFGVNLEGRDIWSTNYTNELAVAMIFVFVCMIFVGFVKKDESARTLLELNEETGRLVTDFFILYGKHLPLINMGILGIVYTIFTLMWAGTLNGPFVAGIFTIAGFAGFGLNIRNVMPITIGAVLGSMLNIWPHDSNTLMVIILFGTALAPFAGYYGMVWGIIAGFIHMCITLNLSGISAGINLYNNGFIAGIVVICLLPVASSLRDDYY